MIYVQLLFNKKPKAPKPEKLKNALEKYLGNVGMSKDNPTNVGTNNMFVFPLLDHKTESEENKEGLPALASFIQSSDGKALEVDEMTRRQFWDVKNGSEIIDKGIYNLFVFTNFGEFLHYKEQAEILLAQIDAALDCYPNCTGIYVPLSGKLITPESFKKLRGYSLSVRFVKLFVNARFFNITNTNEMVIDTLGFYAFYGADIQVHFKDVDPNNIVSYVYNWASYQFDNDFPIKSGDTIDSIDLNGNMQMSPQWKVQYEDSLIPPERTVLDINCGEFAGGNREE